MKKTKLTMICKCRNSDHYLEFEKLKESLDKEFASYLHRSSLLSNYVSELYIEHSTHITAIMSDMWYGVCFEAAGKFDEEKEEYPGTIETIYIECDDVMDGIAACILYLRGVRKIGEIDMVRSEVEE